MSFQNLPSSLPADPNLLNPNLPGFDSENCKSLYVGNLDLKVNETLLYQVFSALGPVEGCKLIKDKSGESAGYGFVDYYDHQFAALALINLNGRKIYNNELKVNWAYAGSQREDTTTHFHIFVGDLSPEIDDTNLFKAFSAFGSCSDARVMWDQTTGRSRGYGFVAFRKKEDAERALTDMNGEWLGSRAIRCNWANQKVNSNSPADLNDSSLSSVINSSSPTNTTVYIGNLPSDASDQFLRSVFSEFGLIEEIRIQKDRGFGFVRFQAHDSAARAIVSVNGRNIGGSRPVRCSWGKERSANQPQSTAQVVPAAVSYPYPYMSINPYTYAPQYSQEYYPANYTASIYGYPPNYQQYNGSHS